MIKVIELSYDPKMSNKIKSSTHLNDYLDCICRTGIGEVYTNENSCKNIYLVKDDNGKFRRYPADNGKKIKKKLLELVKNENILGLKNECLYVDLENDRSTFNDFEYLIDFAISKMHKEYCSLIFEDGKVDDFFDNTFCFILFVDRWNITLDRFFIYRKDD